MLQRRGGVLSAVQFVQFAGTGPGAGKTTLSRALAARLAGAEHVPEDALFSLPELAPLAATFRAGRHPGPGELLDSFARFLAARPPEVRWIVNDGSWLLLAEDLDWAQSAWAGIVDFSMRLRELAAPWHPVVLYVDTPVDVAVARARVRDGVEGFDRWVASMRRLPALAEVAHAPVAELVAAASARVRALLDAGGWPVEVLDGSVDADALVDAAVERLAGRRPTVET